MTNRVVLALVGAFVGGYVSTGGRSMLGILVGLTIGFLVARFGELSQRVKRLEQQRDQQAPSAPEEAVASEPAPQVPSPTVQPEPAPTPIAAQAAPTPAEAAASRPADPAPIVNPAAVHHRAPKEPDWFDRTVTMVKGWITSGNVPVKVGIIISFLGVSFLLKYAMDRELLVLPIELRLLAVALAAIGLIVFGWRLRTSKRVYSLSLQGGGIGMLYLVIFAAFRLYELVPAEPAFLLLVVLTALAGSIAILQDAKILAVFAIVGGFLAPVLISTGSGNHVALFSYYFVLNLAIFGIAQFRAWRELNVLGFLFTFIIGSAWGYQYYKPALFSSTEPFLVGHFLLYQAIAVMFALRQPPKLKGLVDGTLVFGTPVVSFALQAALVRDTEFGLAISAAVVGIFYSLLAAWLWSKHRRKLQLVTESYIALGIAFATIAIPLALDARWTAAAWALEGAALAWLGARQNNTLSKLAGVALVFASGVSFIDHGWRNGAGLPILNGNLLGAWLIAWGAFTASRFLHNSSTPSWERGLSVLLFGWGSMFWLGAGILEIEDRVATQSEPQWITLFVAASGLLCTLVAGWRQWSLARVATLAHLPLLVAALISFAFNVEHPFAGWGALAWLAAVAVQLKILRDYEGESAKLAGLGHGLLLALVTVILMWEIAWQVDARQLSDVWVGSAMATVPFAVVAATLFALGRLAWPVNRHRGAFIEASGALLGLAYLLVIGVVSENPGAPTPLDYIPLFNPHDVVTLIALVAAVRWLLVIRDEDAWRKGDRFKMVGALFACGAFVLTTIAVVRGVHHTVGTDWSANGLANSVAVQAALSIYWGSLGVAGMVWGARKSRRSIWLLGAALMALVVVKLFLVDLGNSETVARIVSFIGVGALFLVVGYFAPAPPRSRASAGEAST